MRDTRERKRPDLPFGRGQIFPHQVAQYRFERCACAQCDEHGLLVVRTFVREPVRGRPPYFRLTGAGAPNHRYTDDELVHLHGLCTAERPMYDSNSAYCVFGNASMREDAERLRAMLASA